MNSRSVFDGGKVSGRVAAVFGNNHATVIKEISEAIKQNDVVVVGMSMNPFVIKARKNLDKLGIPFTYLEYGTYFNNYDLRVAIKMWSGWATFPQIFVKGTFIGGSDDLNAEIADGTFQKRLSK